MEKWDIWIVALAIVFCLMLLGATFFGQVMRPACWGLSYGEAGTPPAGPLSQDTLRRFGAFYLGNPEEHTVCLTFDAAFEAGFTGKILDALRLHHAPAAFFLTEGYLEQNADLVRRMVREGHSVGLRSADRREERDGSQSAELAQELQRTQARFSEIIGRTMEPVYRPSMGFYSEASLKMAQKLGLATVFWSLAHAERQPQAAIDVLCRRIHPGAVVLLCAASETDAEILGALLTRWEDMGYRFTPLSQLIFPVPAV